ncbi:hypothetical protein Tco_0969455 [Tanacetum coccineum]
MVIEMFQDFNGISSSTPSGGCLAKPPSYTEGKQLSIVKTTKESRTEHVEKELEVEDVEIEPKHQPQVTEPIPITIFRPITQPNPKVETIESSSRLQLTDTILEILIPQTESSQATPKPDRERVVHEEAAKARVDPKILASAKGG